LADGVEGEEGIIMGLEGLEAGISFEYLAQPPALVRPRG
jgi:hypothetical protein